MKVLDLTREYKAQDGEIVVKGSINLFNGDDREFGKVVLPLHVKDRFGENKKYEYLKPKGGENETKVTKKSGNSKS